MENKFNTPQEERAYRLGQIDSMLQHITFVMKNLKQEYEKLYQKKLDFEKSEKK